MFALTTLLTLFSATLVVATPVTKEEKFSEWLGGEVLKKCTAAGDCEEQLLNNPYWVQANKPGHQKRDYDCHNAGMHVVVTSGSSFVKFGSTNPYDLFHHVYDLCHEGGCDSGSDYSVSTKYTTALGLYSTNIKVSSQGVYSGWDIRNALADALADASSKNQVWSNEVYCPSGGRACSFGRAWQGWAPNFQQSALYNGCSQYGWMNAKTDGLTGVTSNGACKDILSNLGGLVGAQVPWAGALIPILGWFCN
ncbi:Ff.00g062540.m01.CDS01 [Fusarium sp. VM40]|nr:Ff.00g062540.m01.CDS01 [Fusarium sp. VM40]